MVFEALKKDTEALRPLELTKYKNNLEQSWVMPELYQVRNIRPAFKKGFWAGLAYSAIDTYLFRGKVPWTFHHHPDLQ